MGTSRILLLLLFLTLFEFHSHASPTGALVKHLTSVLKWTRAVPPKTTQSDADHLQFESGYLVETLVEGNKLGVVPQTIRISSEGELFVVDAENSNIVRITPPLSQYSRTRLVAGSFQGYSGHVDGKPSDARFNHPKGVTMDDKGNVYVADTSNLAIRKIGESGVTTIAGGKSNVAGYRDGPSEDAKFSPDFDVVYVKSTCSLIVVDRGNAALRQISLQQQDCNYQSSSVSASDIIMVVGAIFAGYASCLLQHGSVPTFFSKKESEHQGKETVTEEKPKLVVESLKEDPVAGWPSFGTLIADLFKFGMEGLGSIFLNIVPHSFRFGKAGKQGLTPLKDRLVMPVDKETLVRPVNKEEPSFVQKQHNSQPIINTSHVVGTSSDTPQNKSQKSTKPSKSKDALLSSKHRSSRKQEYAEFYGPGESPQVSSKSQKERIRHRHRDKSEVGFGAVSESKSSEMKSMDYGDSKFDHYGVRTKFSTDGPFRF